MRRLIENQPAWLLHSRPFRDTSLLLDFLTLDHGRVSAVARGVRSAKSGMRALLQPFRPLSVSLSGTSELLSLRQAEARGAAFVLAGERLFAAMYVNELLVRLLGGHEGEASLFGLYGGVLDELRSTASLEPLLRGFELKLLDVLGYGLQFSHEAASQEPIVAGRWYYLGEDGSFVQQMHVAEPGPGGNGELLFPGHELHLIAADDFSADTTRRIAKRLLRQALQQHLSGRPLTSRLLFRSSGNAGE